MSSVGVESFSDIVERIYRSSMGDASRLAVIRQITERLNGCAGVFCVTNQAGDVLVLDAVGLRRDVLRRFLKRELSRDDSLSRECIENADEGVVCWRDFQQGQTGTAKRCDRPLARLQFFVGLRFQLSGLAPPLNISLAVFRDRRDFSGSATAVRFFKQLYPHMRQAVKNGVALRLRRAQTSALSSFLEFHPNGVIILDEQRTILFSNRYAREILGRSDGLLLQNARVTARRRCDADHLMRLIETMFDDGVNAKPKDVARLLIPRCPDANYLVRVTPLRRTYRRLGRQTPVVALSIGDGEPAETVQETLNLIFGLTGRQAELTMAIFEGRTLTEAANHIGVSRNTAKEHLREIFAKTGVTRQANLVRLVCQVF